MPLPKKGSKNCVGNTIDIEKAHGKPYEQARAIALSHCQGPKSEKKKDKKNEDTGVKIEKILKSLDKDLDDIYSLKNYLYSIKDMMKYPDIAEAYKKIKDKVEKDMEKIGNVELEKLKKAMEETENELKSVDVELAKQKKWMQKAAAKMKAKGTENKTTNECKKMGYKGVTDECLNKLKARGGKWAQRANFAKTARKVNK